MQETIQSGELNFSIDSSLLFQLGEQLVAKPSIALAELVKNAYDADATKVRITMENVERKGGTIVVEDNGHGMTFDELEANWMRIATNTKRETPVSRIFRRPLTGAKGIGRFAARRLGNKLIVQTISEIRDESANGFSKESVVVEFDWKKSFQPGSDLIAIPVVYTRQPVPVDTQTGVSLFIEDARDSWDEDTLGELRRDLLTIQSPFPDLTVQSDFPWDGQEHPFDPGFDVEFEIAGSEELENLSGDLGEAFLGAAWAKLDGYIDEKGKAHYDLAIRVTGETDNLSDTSNDYSGLEQARLRIYYFIYTADYFEQFDFGVRDVQRKGRSEGGVRIYLDRFRVFPYGDPKNDWLGLDEFAARNIDLATEIAPPEKVMELASSVPGRPFLLIPRNYQLFGAVSISQTLHSGVEINVSRENLIESPTEARLRRFVLNGIYWMTIKRGAYLAEERNQRRRQKPKKTVPEIINEAKEAIDRLEIPEERREVITLALDKAIEQVQEEEEERISEISMLRILASAGTTLALMNHQLRTLISSVLQIREELKELQLESPPELHQKLQDITSQVAEWYQMVQQQVSQLGFLLSPDSRLRRKRHVLYEVVEDVRRPMAYYMNKYNIEFQNEVPRNLRTPPIYQSELYSILINVLSNALKAVHGQSEKRIAVGAEKENGTLFIRMLDTGVGLPNKDRERVFKPFVTMSVTPPLLGGVGTGLGLKVVRDTLELYAGTARFIDVESPWRTCIEIVLPERGQE